jgi:cell wall-associated NlpC family hydrolase
VASNRHIPLLVRLAVATAISSLTIGLLPGAGQAAPVKPVTAPKTASEAAQKVQQLGDQLEVLSEEVNGAQIRVGKLRVAALRATRQAAAADQRYATLSAEVAKIVRSTYTSAPFGQFTTLMTSDSPQDFLEQLSTLERMSEQRSRVIGSVLRAKQQLDQARDKARKTLGAAHLEYATAVAKKKRLQQQIVQYKAIYNRLSAQERAQLNGGTSATRSGRIPTGNLPPMSGRAKIAVDTALAQQGKPYVWGAAGPSSFDCSGLTMYSWGKAGVALPHQSAEQYSYGTHVPTDLAYLKPGDLLFFYSPIHHVAMYIGNGMQVHAPTSGDVVRVVGVDWRNLVGATRLS